jgi:hypothetical protein
MTRFASATLLGFSLAFLVAETGETSAQAVAAGELIKAAKAATISEVDYARRDCGDDRTIEDWLREVVGASAKSIRWAGGRCVLAIKERARDAGTKWCAHAVITPKQGRHTATVEIYFEAPQRGRPGKPFAFRSSVHTKAGPDYSRETSAFEANWGETYVPDYKPPEQDECN